MSPDLNPRRRLDLNKPLPQIPGKQSVVSSRAISTSNHAATSKVRGPPNDLQPIADDEKELKDSTSVSSRISLFNRRTQSNSNKLPEIASNDQKDGFKAYKYDDVSERPIMLHPQTRLIDLPRHKESKISMKRLLRRTSSKSTPDELSLANVKERLTPPRPPRPPHHLCPSPPHNTENLPGWKILGTSDLNSVAGRSRSTSSMMFERMQNLEQIKQIPVSHRFRAIPSQQRGSTGFVRYGDIHSKKPQLDMATSKKMRGTCFSTADIALDGTEGASRSITPPVPVRGVGHNRNITKVVSAGVPVNTFRIHRAPIVRSYKARFVELDNIPEDASVHEFSHKDKNYTHESGDLQTTATSTYTSSTSEMNDDRLSRLSNSSSDSTKSEHGSSWLGDDQDFYQREYERVRAISHHLREQYKNEWDNVYDDTPQSSRSYSENGSLSDNDPPYNVAVPRAAGEVFDTRASKTQTSSLVPAPLRLSNSFQRLSDDEDDLSTTGILSHKSQHLSPHSYTISTITSPSMHQDQLLPGSTPDRHSSESSVSELEECDEILDSRASSPLLPTPPSSPPVSSPRRSTLSAKHRVEEEEVGAWNMNQVQSVLRLSTASMSDPQYADPGLWRVRANIINHQAVTPKPSLPHVKPALAPPIPLRSPRRSTPRRHQDLSHSSSTSRLEPSNYGEMF